MSENVVFKGSRSGLELVVKEEADFSEILIQLRNKLETAMDFFGKGTVFHIAEDKLTNEQQSAMKELLEDYGMQLQVLQHMPEAVENLDCGNESKAVEEDLVIKQTVRGGQEIVSRGSIIIKGNVNPGAEVIAGGNIDVWGTCRGIVHAGAFGDVKATIIADRMMAIQVRIADLIARSPDQLEEARGPECARIKEGAIIIEPVKRQEVSQ